jgi:hypothetical protein
MEDGNGRRRRGIGSGEEGGERRRLGFMAGGEGVLAPTEYEWRIGRGS